MLNRRFLVFFIAAIVLTSNFLLINVNQVGAANLDKPPAQFMVVSQVRGPECCDPGNLDNLKFQIDEFKKNDIPAYLTLRYDALTNPEYVKYAKNEMGEGIRFGLFLEITPQLAQDSGVEYNGDPQNWYQAQQAYTIGLLPQDREKVIDQLFKTFYQQFGYYPELTAAWITDTPTLNYLHDKYGVKVHEITREQWGTDSYTLWGGVEHYPYPASRQWAFMPDFDQLQPLVIIRQTISDPLASYGDVSSSFTSQPNDYVRDGKNFTYFTSLINQTIHQPEGQIGFGVIGLETSMDQNFHQELSRQLVYLKDLQQDHQLIFIQPSQLNTINTQRMSVYAGSDLIKNNNNISYTINSPNYRIRLRQNIKQVFIDDIRVYHPNFSDPYLNYQGFQGGYWIAPDLIDGGRWYSTQLKKPILNRLFDPPQLTSSIYLPTQQDMSGDPSRIELPEILAGQKIEVKVNEKNNEVIAIYQAKDQKTISMIFASNQVKISPADINLRYISHKPEMILNHSTQNPIVIDNPSEISWPSDQPLVKLTNKCGTADCILTFSSQPDQLEQIRNRYYPFLFPEKKIGLPDPRQSLIFAHNRYALANQNPVRIVVAPFDQNQFPVSLTTSPMLATEPAIDRISQPTISPNHVATYFDLHHSQPQAITVTVELNNYVKKTEKVFFAPNCKFDLKYCLTHPRQAWWYLRFRIWDWMRNRLEKSASLSS